MSSQSGQGITPEGLLAVVWTFSAVTTLLFGGRLIIRFMMLKSFHTDDAFSALAWLFMILCIIFATISNPISYMFSSILIGETPAPSMAEFADITISLRRWNVVGQTFFWLSLFCVKFSFLFLYRLVLGQRPGWRVVWNIAFGYVVVSLAVCLIGVYGQCGDVRNLFSYEQCLTPYVAQLTARLIWVVFFFNVTSDLVVVLLPMPVIWGLNMATKQKLAITGICALAAVTIVFEIVRSVKLYSLNFNLTNLYSYLELLITVLISMLPSYRFMVGAADKDREYRRLFWSRLTMRSYRSGSHNYSMHSYDRTSRATESGRNMVDPHNLKDAPPLPKKEMNDMDDV